MIVIQSLIFGIMSKLIGSLALLFALPLAALLWIARNRAGTLVKILRGGEIELSSRLLKDSASLKVDIHFGENNHLEMAAVPTNQGEKELAKVLR